MPPVDPTRLRAACARHLGPATTVAQLRRLSGGASRETWSFDARHPDGTVEALVLRRDPGSTIGSTDRATEYDLLRAAGDACVAVPAVRFLLEPDDDLGAGFVMARIDGETIPRKILRDPEYAPARAVMTAQCAAAAAAIHAIPRDALPRLALLDAPALVEQFTGVVDTFGEPHPAFELALRWLTDHLGDLPATDPVLVHGDLRTGNLVVGPEGLRAVLDWELAHLGDPVEDLGWFCVKSWRFGNVDRRAGGFGTAEELLATYTAASGRPVTTEQLFFWEVLGTLKWGVICEMQTFSHLHGLVRSVELAAIGRRVAENEWDLLALLDPDGSHESGPPESVDVADGPAASLSDRPNVLELVEAVREFVERDVMKVEGRVGFHGRVAARVLTTVERELVHGPRETAAERARLGGLLGVDPATRTVWELQTALATGLRSGAIATSDPDVLAVIRASVRAKLALSNPKYLDEE